jgi:hypothetical protein
MSYNSEASAESIIGQPLGSDLLSAAQAIIHAYTDYRWVSTTITETFSGDGESTWMNLRAPIISVTSLTIDDVSQTESTDFEIRKTNGMIRIYSVLPWGHDNIAITYAYGWTSTYGFYNDTLPLVKLAEAQIALYLKKNPLGLKSSGVEGLNMSYQDDQIGHYLSIVPRMPVFTAMGPESITESHRII